tara:strand:+ start:762 stop:1538 length:777 start_codon:yes stop_codon:yes gene_type:complete
MIYLFGDSFVYRQKVKKLGIRDYPRWQDILSDQCDEENFNFGENGEGSYETMHKFCNLFEKQYFEDNDKFVVVLSSSYRVPWKWGKDSASWYSKWLGVKCEDIDEQKKFVLDSFYECMSDECSRNILKNLIFLHHLSNNYKMKMCVFTAFRDKEYENEKIINSNIYELDNLNTEYFYFHSTPLYEHSKKEGKYHNLSKGLINHLSERNHKILANIITNHFCNTEFETKFHENFIIKKVNASFQYTEVLDDKYCEFIYE